VALVIDVITAGDAFQDVILSGLSHLPALGEEAWAERLDRDLGGGAPITACGLAKLGFRASLLSCAGASDSEWLRRRLRDCGIDDGLLQVHPTLGTGLTVAASTAQDRVFYSYAGANAALRLDAEALPSARVLHLALRPPTDIVSIIDTLHRRGFFVSLDIGWHPDWLRDRASLDCLRALDLFLPNDREAQAVTGESEPLGWWEAFHRMGMNRVAVKRGAEGASLLWDGCIYHCPAPPVNCVDTTGAGDCFDAGFLAAWLRGWAPPECLRAGVFCGSQSTRTAGGIAGFPTAEEFATWQTKTK
jgi:sugar/nucleoside kinase (ribokinase family)